MSLPDHPMRRFARENPDAMRQHMAQVRAHRKPATTADNPQASLPPARSEREVAERFMARKRS